MKHFIDEATQLIQTSSVSTDGNEELSNTIAGLMRDWGFNTQVQGVTHSIDNISKRQFNVVGILGDPLVDRKIRKGLLFLSHLDTVDAGLKEHWTETEKNPYKLTLKDNRLYGLGVADAKIDFLCKLHAAGRFREKKLKMPIYLVGTCGKELGMFGARYLIKALTLNPLYTLISEPTELRLIHAQKRMSGFKVSIDYRQLERDARGFNRRIQLRTFGRSAHASTPHLGTNALLGMLDFLQRAADNGFELRFIQFSGGDIISKVPDSAEADFCLSSHQLEDFKRFFREMVKIAGTDRVYQVDLGGIGEAGIRFMPDVVFSCMAETVGLFEKIAQDLTKVRDGEYQPPYSTINFGKITQTLSGIDLHFDLRLLPNLSMDDIEKHIRDGMMTIAKGYPSLNLNFQRDRSNPGLDIPAESEWIQTCTDLQRDMGWAATQPLKSSTSTEAALFHQAGYNTVAFGPGKIQGNSHGPNECVEVRELEMAIQFYEKLIERTCL